MTEYEAKRGIEAVELAKCRDWGASLMAAWQAVLADAGRLTPPPVVGCLMPDAVVAALMLVDSIREFERMGGRIVFIDPPDKGVSDAL
jgi:hypothetical protein